MPEKKNRPEHPDHTAAEVHPYVRESNHVCAAEGQPCLRRRGPSAHSRAPRLCRERELSAREPLLGLRFRSSGSPASEVETACAIHRDDTTILAPAIHLVRHAVYMDAAPDERQ